MCNNVSLSTCSCRGAGKRLLITLISDHRLHDWTEAEYYKISVALQIVAFYHDEMLKLAQLLACLLHKCVNRSDPDPTSGLMLRILLNMDIFFFFLFFKKIISAVNLKVIPHDRGRWLGPRQQPSTQPESQGPGRGWAAPTSVRSLRIHPR